MEWMQFIFTFTLLFLVQGRADAEDNGLAFVEDMQRGPNSRVVAGWDARLGQFPFQIHLRMVNEPGSTASCGGSVIHHQWILTAAHCLRNRFNFVIRAGMVNITRPAWIVETAQKFSHPLYNVSLSNVQRHDIGLLKLEHHLPYNEYLQPIRLMNSQQKDLDYTGVKFTVSGYGLTDDVVNGGAVSETLQWVHLRGISNEECLSWYPNSVAIAEQTVCAEYYNDTAQSSCSGDSGGPLTIVDEDGQLTEIGIVHFGSSLGCNSPYPAGYVRPGWYHDWLTEITGINFDWTPNANTNKNQPIDLIEEDVTLVTRMDGGYPSNQGDNPWLTHLRMTKFSDSRLESCVGSLIDNTWVLTSASCINNSRVLWVRYGVVDVPNPELVTEGGVVLYLHPQWHPELGTHEYDLALVKVNRPVHYEEHIQPITPAVGDFEVPKTGRFCSWGANNDKAGENLYCIDAQLQEMSDGTIYAYSDQGHATQFDLGAPLISNGVQIGVLSKYPTPQDSFSAVFVQPRSYLDFISKETGLEFPETHFSVEDAAGRVTDSIFWTFVGSLMAVMYNAQNHQ